MTVLKVGVIGCGAIAQMMHLPFLKKLEDRYSIEAVCDVSPGLTEAMAKQYNVPFWSTDYRELLKRDIDAVFILSGGSHAEMIIESAKAGKHIFVEKPICFTPDEGEEVLKVLKKTNVKILVAYMKRFDPAYVKAKELVSNIKGIAYIDAVVLHPDETMYMEHYGLKRFNDIDPNIIKSFQEKSKQLAIQGVGEAPEHIHFAYTEVALSSMVHDTNAVRGLIGEPEEVVYSKVWNNGNAVEVTLRYPNNVMFTCTWLFLPDLRNYEENIGFYGNNGRLVLGFPSPYLKNQPTRLLVEYMEDGASVKEEITVNYEEAFEQEQIHFHDV
ncbi:MAG: Gfo/Idh/MocA family protein, partial [Eubacteriales bacterium]